MIVGCVMEMGSQIRSSPPSATHRLDGSWDISTSWHVQLDLVHSMVYFCLDSMGDLQRCTAYEESSGVGALW